MKQPQYRHKLVQGLYELLQEYIQGKGGGNLLFSALMFGIRGELPHILKSLDENPEMVKMIREKLEKVLIADESTQDIKPNFLGGGGNVVDAGTKEY